MDEVCGTTKRYAHNNVMLSADILPNFVKNIFFDAAICPFLLFRKRIFTSRNNTVW